MASMAGVPGGARGRRALDATMNLVPFIDLLSCCIAFLLITAVWTAVARVDVATAGRSVAGDEEAPATAPPWTLYVTSDGWTLRAPDGTQRPAPQEKLAAMLREHAIPEPLVVHAADGVTYATLVDALDVARGAGIVTVTVSGDGE